MQKPIYPFWNMKPGQELVVRFLPDLKEDNPYDFIDGYHYHNMEVDGKLIKALCSKMHEDTRTCLHCKIAEEAFRRQYSTESRKYWRKQQYNTNVLIVDDPLGITASHPASTSFHLILSPMIFNQIKDELINGKINYAPSSYKHGHNFVIRVDNQNGPYKKYIGEFRRKSSSLTSDEIAIADNALIDLSTLRPTKFSADFEDEISKKYVWDRLSQS